MTSPRDQADELYQHRHDPDEWAEEPEQIEVRPARSSVLSVRLPRNEFDALEAAAAERGESVSQYVRTALALRLSGNVTETARPVVTSASGVVGYPAEFVEKRVWSSSGASVAGTQSDDGQDIA